MGTESCQKLSNGYFTIPVMGNEMIMYEIWVISNGRVMGMVLFCGSIMTMDNVMEKVPINITVIDNEIEWVKSSSMSNVNSNGCIAAHY